MLKVFLPNPMILNLQRISVTHTKVQFLYRSVQRVLYDLIKYFRPFSITSQTLNSCKVESTYISSARQKLRKITKILRSLCCQANIDSFQSIQYSWLDAMNFQKWELFLAHPVYFEYLNLTEPDVSSTIPSMSGILL